MDRRFFVTGALVSGSKLLLSENVSLGAENALNALISPKPTIVARPTWDDMWPQIVQQYHKVLGDSFDVVVNGKKLTKTVDVLNYLQIDLQLNVTTLSLEQALKRIILHHTAPKKQPQGSAESQLKAIRNKQLGDMNFNDLGYPFLIATDGTILEGRPLLRVGSHSGYTLESSTYMKSNLPGGVKSIYAAQKAGNRNLYLERLRHYVTAMQMDPDYGSIGIAFVGNFHGDGGPNQVQLQSAISLINYLKSHYHIPMQGIMGHSDVKQQVVGASGLTLSSKDTVCPGNGFPDLSAIKSQLVGDTSVARKKSIFLG